MRIRELGQPKILISLTNEENKFLNTHRTAVIDLKRLDPRDQRIAENLIYKDILCKINDSQVRLNGHETAKFKSNSKST